MKKEACLFKIWAVNSLSQEGASPSMARVQNINSLDEIHAQNFILAFVFFEILAEITYIYIFQSSLS